MRSKWDKAFAQRVGELSRTQTVYEVAEATGMSESCLYVNARKHGIHFQTRNRRRYTPQHQMTEIAEAKAETAIAEGTP